ncbi:type I CRISPR-associated protein Cas7 [Siphonobacter sp. SORGH_AS_0500]|uniref:type I CRISPR-associated protein Cas7 n=1 Tax=Siphonobacter sp. SORGH_AS_0500 TaxID=1864824 RepID=UPI00285E49C2|nr:type I CRISPR-associated protein Cas7 [Siphonobacter sp. SORGH_AS_0500]MDR6197582.1 CRISPR/Cas system type I-B associated protein Csh2 (Cas7 group RAMP superfamily) [Siphonobacter sp. SORGH_AS_0500]
MTTAFTNRVFGCVVIKSVNSNYNADFTHQPRTLPDGTVYATDKALKYTVRNYLKKAYPDDKVFYFKTMDSDFKPRTLDESYVLYFGDFPKKSKKKDNPEPEKFYLFKYDGDSVTGLLPGQIKPATVKKYFNSLGEDSDLKQLANDFNKVTGKKAEQQTTDFVLSKLMEEQEESFWYIENGKLQKINGSFIDIETVANELDNLVTGGLDRKIMLSNLLTCIDVRLFGGTYAGQANLSIHGPLQITHGVNRYVEGIIYSEQIMSPFRNPGEKSADSTMSTLGTQSKLKEGHYVHGLSLNPHNISDLIKLSSGQAITNDDITKVKNALTQGATLYDSAAKAGTENELMLWVQLKPGSMLVLPSFVELISVDADRVIHLEKVTKILERPTVSKHIEKIELYYDKTVTQITGAPTNATILELNQ